MKALFRRSCLLLTGLVLLVSAFGQPEVASSKIRELERGPASPNTATLGRYFDVPVDMSTGVASFSIPLLTIKTGDASLPISLNYHGGGIKVNDPASWVGLGWSLNCGGIINKQINGLDDFYATTQTGAVSDFLNPSYTIDGNFGFTGVKDLVENGLLGNFSVTNGNDLFKILGRFILNKYDGEADEFSFLTPQGGGTMFWSQEDQAFRMSSINGWKNSYDPNTDTWHITTNDGKVYDYEARESRLKAGYGQPSPGQQPSPTSLVTTAWYLTKITDIPSGRSIDLTYDQTDFKYTTHGTSLSRDYILSPPAPSFNGENPVLIERYGNDVTITGVSFNEGSIQFIKDNQDRLDLVGPRALKEIRVLDKTGNLKKKFILSYTYASTRLFLQSVQEINFENQNPSFSRPYQFAYENSIVMSSRFSYAQDIYGYYNGKTSNTTIIPTTAEAMAISVGPFANRYIDADYTQAGVLKEVTYPTGGQLKFIYENNRDDADSLVGGLRIKKIINKDQFTNKELTTEYSYTGGQLAYRPTFSYYLAKGTGTIGQPNFVIRVMGEPIYPYFGNQGSPVYYSSVDKKETGGTETIKTTHYFEMGSIDPGGFRNLSIGVPNNKYASVRELEHKEHLVEYYKQQGGIFKLVKTAGKSWVPLNSLQKYIWNMQMAWCETGTSTFSESAGWDPYTTTPLGSQVSVNAYKMFTESMVVNSDEQKTYIDNGNYLLQKTDRTYDQTNGNVKTQTTVQSDGSVIKVYYSYPTDFNITTGSNPANNGINTLRFWNMVSSPIEVVTTYTKSGITAETVTDASLIIYEGAVMQKVYKLAQPVLLSAFTFASNNNSGFYYDTNYQLESEITAYGVSANPEEIVSRSSIQSIIWDDENRLAVIQGAAINQVAFTSFETSAKGKWTYTGTPQADADARTGKKVYDLATGNITRTSLDVAKTYTISFWSKGGSQTVNGNSVTASKTVGSWNFYVFRNITPSSGTITVSGTGKVDELRLAPTNAMMTSFTYDGLIGMTSQTDVAGNTSFYEYDGLGRLFQVKDINKNIIKKICYNYAGQVEDCGQVYSNVLKSQNFTRNNCGYNGIGSTVTYTVPAGSYFSNVDQQTANQLAQNDIDANGQNYANVHGTCVWYNEVQSANFTRNNCGTGYTGSTVTYTIPANTYTSTSVASANALAIAALAADGQAYANSNGTCTPIPCNPECPFPSKKCVNGTCVKGVVVYTSSVYNSSTGEYACTFHYSYLDGSISPDYLTYSPTPCL